MNFQRPSESHLATRAQKSSKLPSRGYLRAIWAPESRIVQNDSPEAISEPFGHESPEELKMIFQRPSESQLATRAQKNSK